MKKLLIVAALATFCACSAPRRAEKVAVIPQPVYMQLDKGEFILASPITICYPAGNAALEKAAQRYAEVISQKFGGKVTVTDKAQQGAIVLQPLDEPIKPEAYKLEVDNDNIEVKADDYSGAIYALQTLLQLMPNDVYAPSGEPFAGQKIAIPALTMTDYPRFEWRGMHLDVSRHFFDATQVKKYLDYMAMHKLNRFHWHLTDDQGWRMESKKFPLLTQKAAWRVDRSDKPWDDRLPLDTTKGEKATYGGFFTQDEIRDIVAYAAARGIQVMPEIEMPGHSSEVFAAYPELSCLGKEQFVTPGGHYPEDMATGYCAGNEDTFTFLEGIIDETIELFPDAPYIHIGGDELDKRFWKNCPKCKARMQTEGLASVDELQSYFIKRMEKYINSKGKQIVGWDEILEGGVAPNATIMSWRGIAGGIEAARAGHDVIMVPNSHLYFDYYQNDPSVEPTSIGGFIPAKKVYQYDPIPEALTADQAKHIKGVQANLWAEFIQTFDHVEYMVLPRMAAMAEVAWSPKESKEWANFSERLEQQQKRYKAMGANAHPGCDQVDFLSIYDDSTKSFKTEMVSEIFGTEIFYTTDGEEPTTASTKYIDPVTIDRTTTFKAIVAHTDGTVISKKASERTIGMHKGIGKTVTYNKAPSEAYLASGAITLVDGLTSGATNHSDGFWQGFNSADFDVVIDLEQTTSFTKVVGSFLQSVGTWIYLPQQMVVSVSDDGKNFKEIGRVSHTYDATTQAVRHQFVLTGQFSGRYVRVVGVNPPAAAGLPGAGFRNWIFADEIFIN